MITTLQTGYTGPKLTSHASRPYYVTPQEALMVGKPGDVESAIRFKLIRVDSSWATLRITLPKGVEPIFDKEGNVQVSERSENSITAKIKRRTHFQIGESYFRVDTWSGPQKAIVYMQLGEGIDFIPGEIGEIVEVAESRVPTNEKLDVPFGDLKILYINGKGLTAINGREAAGNTQVRFKLGPCEEGPAGKIALDVTHSSQVNAYLFPLEGGRPITPRRFFNEEDGTVLSTIYARAGETVQIGTDKNRPSDRIISIKILAFDDKTGKVQLTKPAGVTLKV